MKIAELTAELSYAERLKVGCIIVKNNRIISIGYNGTPPGKDNCCEEILEDNSLKTKKEVIHAEANALGKLAQSNESGKNATMFITHSPCIECAKILLISGINKIFYKTDFRCSHGLEFLKDNLIEVEKV